MLCAQTSLVWASLLQWPLDCLSQTRAFDQTTIVIVEQQKSIENPLGSTANASLLRAARVVPSLSKPHLSTAFQLNYLECVRNYVLSGISTIHIFDHRFIFEINKRFFFSKWFIFNCITTTWANVHITSVTIWNKFSQVQNHAMHTISSRLKTMCRETCKHSS